MKKITYLLLGVLLCLTSCFKDEGNYDYSETNPPHWLNASSVPSFYAFDAREVTLVGENLFGILTLCSVQKKLPMNGRLTIKL